MQFMPPIRQSLVIAVLTAVAAGAVSVLYVTPTPMPVRVFATVFAVAFGLAILAIHYVYNFEVRARRIAAFLLLSGALSLGFKVAVSFDVWVLGQWTRLPSVSNEGDHNEFEGNLELLFSRAPIVDLACLALAALMAYLSYRLFTPLVEEKREIDIKADEIWYNFISNRMCHEEFVREVESLLVEFPGNWKLRRLRFRLKEAMRLHEDGLPWHKAIIGCVGGSSISSFTVICTLTAIWLGMLFGAAIFASQLHW